MRDAVLAYDRWEYKLEERRPAVMRWDGKTYKKSPTTGEDIPDESAQVAGGGLCESAEGEVAGGRIMWWGIRRLLARNACELCLGMATSTL